MRRVRSLGAGVALCLTAVGAGAQQAPADSAALSRALELEMSSKYREAAPLFRTALQGGRAVDALLGLERVYFELGWTDSLLAPLDTLIARSPREGVYREVQLRALQMLQRDAAQRQAFERWTREVPGDAMPYRTYSRMLLDRGLTIAADSVLRRAREALGGDRDVQIEVAQLRAASGQWAESAAAWRIALEEAPHVDQAAVFALGPTPVVTRPAVRDALLAGRPYVPARRVIALLELAWGSAGEGWAALRDLPPDTAAYSAWMEFGERAEAEERWPLAREAFAMAQRARPSQRLARRAAHAALRSGDAAAAIAIAPIPSDAPDSLVASEYLLLHAEALGMLGRAGEAEQLVTRYGPRADEGLRPAIARALAFAWLRGGDLPRARTALKAAGAEADSSEVAGWIALYEGDLKTARVLLREGTEQSRALAMALAVVARTKSERNEPLGAAFLALARGDTTQAVNGFGAVAARDADLASLLLLTAARLELARGRRDEAGALHAAIVGKFGESPEAPEAELELARALRRKGDTAGAIARLEHMILTHPRSALLPQARRELEQLRGATPGGL